MGAAWVSQVKGPSQDRGRLATGQRGQRGREWQPEVAWLHCTSGCPQLLLLLDQVSNNWNLSLERKERAPDVVGSRRQPKAGKVVQTQQAVAEEGAVRCDRDRRAHWAGLPRA